MNTKEFTPLIEKMLVCLFLTKKRSNDNIKKNDDITRH